MIKYVFLLLMSVIFLACSELKKDNDIYGSWRLQDINTTSKNVSFEQKANLIKPVSDGILLSLFTDRSYTYITGSGEYVNGKFHQSGSDKIEFRPENVSIKDADFSLNILKDPFRMILLDEKGIEFIYIKESNSLQTDQEDPFYFLNNTWRIRPDSSETIQQMKKRLACYFKHYALILKAAKDRKQNAVYFGFSQGPIQIYSGAVGIYPYEIVPENWKRSFYNDTDAKTAYLLYQKLLVENKFKGSGSGNWVEDDYHILLALYNGIVDLKE